MKLFSLLLAIPLLAADAEMIKVRLLIPHGDGGPVRVRLDGRELHVLSLEPAINVPTLLVAESSDGGVALNEVSAAYRLGLPQQGIRLYTDGHSNPRLVPAWSSRGPVVGLLDRPEPGSIGALAENRISSFDLFAQIIEPWMGQGPVRIFWIEHDFFWLNNADDALVSSLENHQMWELVGASGVSLVPIETRMSTERGRKKPRLNDKRYREHAANLFGTQPYLTGAPGAALLQAFREAQRERVVTFEMAPAHRTWRGLPRTLTVVEASSNKRIVKRPFVASVGVGKRLTQNPITMSAPRVVPAVTAQGADVDSAACSKPGDGEHTLLLRGLHPPNPMTSQDSFWVTRLSRSGPYQISHTEIEPGSEVPAQSTSQGVCVGPLSLRAATQVVFYSASGDWVTTVNLVKK